MRYVPPYTSFTHTTRSPGSSRCMIDEVAPTPDANAWPWSAFSSEARHSSSAVRVGFETRA